MTSALDITRAVNPPRAAFVDFPLGHTTGKRGDPKLQREILLAALDAFETVTEPGSVRHLPFRWSDDDAWKAEAMKGGDARLARDETPQWQNEEDRRRAEAKT